MTESSSESSSISSLSSTPTSTLMPSTLPLSTHPLAPPEDKKTSEIKDEKEKLMEEPKKSANKAKFLDDIKEKKIKSNLPPSHRLSAEELPILVYHYYEKSGTPIVINGSSPYGQSIISSKDQAWVKACANFRKYPEASYLTQNFGEGYSASPADPTMFIRREWLTNKLTKDKLHFLVKDLFQEAGISRDFNLRNAASLTELQLQKLQEALKKTKYVPIKKEISKRIKEDKTQEEYEYETELKQMVGYQSLEQQEVREEMLRIQKHLIEKGDERVVGYVHTGGRRISKGHSEYYLIFKDYIVKPLSWDDMPDSTYLIKPQDLIDATGQPFYQTNPEVFLTKDAPNLFPSMQADRFSCNHLVFANMKQLSKKKQLGNFTLKFEFYDSNKQLQYYFLNSPQSLRYSHSTKYLEYMNNIVMNDKPFTIFADKKSSLVNTIYSALQQSIEFAKENGQTIIEKKNRNTLAQLIEFRKKWAGAYKFMMEKHGELQFDPFNYTLLYRAFKNKEIVGKEKAKEANLFGIIFPNFPNEIKEIKSEVPALARKDLIKEDKKELKKSEGQIALRSLKLYAPIYQAAKHVNKEYLSTPYLGDTPWGDQADDKPRLGVNRHNNGIANALRCVAHVPVIINFLGKNAKNSELKAFCRSLSPMQIVGLQIAILFSQTGRTCGLGPTDNLSKYQQMKTSSEKNFESYIDTAFPDNQKNAAMRKFLIELLNPLKELGNPKYAAQDSTSNVKSPSLNQKNFQLILTLAHTLEFIRVSNQKSYHNRLSDILKGAGGVDNETDLFLSEDYAIDLLSATGNRVPDFKKSDGKKVQKRDYVQPFGEISHSIPECMGTIAAVKLPQLIMSESDRNEVLLTTIQLSSNSNPSRKSTFLPFFKPEEKINPIKKLTNEAVDPLLNQFLEYFPSSNLYLANDAQSSLKVISDIPTVKDLGALDTIISGLQQLAKPLGIELILAHDSDMNYRMLISSDPKTLWQLIARLEDLKEQSSLQNTSSNTADL